MMIAVFLLLGGDASFSDLIGALGDDSIEVREDAVRRLVAGGEPHRRPLIEARSAARDPEVRGRIDDVLRMIRLEGRKRRFRGGSPSGNLSVSLEVRDRPFRDGITATLEVMNVGNTSATFIPVRCTRVRTRGGSSRCSHDDAEIVIQRAFGQGGRSRPSPFHFCRRSAPRPVILQPGESAAFAKDWKLDPGRYWIHGVVFARSRELSPEVTRDLRTPSVWVAVRKR